jgi:hypothetical protein
MAQMTEHEQYHQVTIETLRSIDSLVYTLVLYSNAMLTLFGIGTLVLLYAIYHRNKKGD